MPMTNKSVLETANEAIRQGDIEGFLTFCTQDIEWTLVGQATLNGKDALRQWMRSAYAEPPRFTVTDLIADADTVVAIGEIDAKDEHGTAIHSAYCDVWRVRDGKLAQLRAFVVEQR